MTKGRANSQLALQYGRVNMSLKDTSGLRQIETATKQLVLNIVHINPNNLRIIPTRYDAPKLSWCNGPELPNEAQIDDLQTGNGSS